MRVVVVVVVVKLAVCAINRQTNTDIIDEADLTAASRHVSAPPKTAFLGSQPCAGSQHHRGQPHMRCSRTSLP